MRAGMSPIFFAKFTNQGLQLRAVLSPSEGLARTSLLTMYLVDSAQVTELPLSQSASLGLPVSYYDPRTLYDGSGEPLSPAKPPRNLLRTGWGPRGDSGPERDRVRATQPANFKFPSLPSLTSKLDSASPLKKHSECSHLGVSRSNALVGWHVACTPKPCGCRRNDGNSAKSAY